MIVCVRAHTHNHLPSLKIDCSLSCVRVWVCVWMCVCVGGWVGACARLHIHASEFKCPIACQGVVHSTDIQV